MATPTKEILTDLSPILKHYADGTVERLFGTPHVPPSPEDPATAVASKDISSIPPGISARIYLPKLSSHIKSKIPILLYFHGGGFCIESAFSSFNHRYMNLLSAESKSLIVSIEYRLAPEHPLPAAFEDSWDSLRWVFSHDAENPPFEKEPWLVDYGDLSRVFVGGDSAGAVLAHYVAMRAGSEPLSGESKLLGAILLQPFFWGSNPIGSEPREDIEKSLPYRIWMFSYPCAEDGIDNPVINPVRNGAPSLSSLGCSRILVCVAEKDVLRGRGIAYAEKVKESGWRGRVEVVESEGVDHAFHWLDPQSDRAKDLISRVASFICV